MLETLTQAQAEQLKILRVAAEGSLPRNIARGSNEFSFDILRELYDSGMITAAYFQAILPEEQCFLDSKITLSGRQYLSGLEKLSVPDHASKPSEAPSNEKKEWHEKPLGLLFIAVASGILIAFVVYLLKNHLGLPL